MKQLKKITTYAAVALLALLITGCAYYWYASSSVSERMVKTYSFTEAPLITKSDEATIARGRHLADIKGCNDCHGKGLSGKVFVDDFPLGRISASNLTRGTGGLPPDYSTADFVMALRHGINKKGKPLIFMPSQESTELSKEDLAAIIAYCQQLPSVNNLLPENRIGPLARVMTHMGKLPLLSVELIEHSKPAPISVENKVGLQQGRYLSVSCVGCHRPGLKGGPPLAPGMLPVPDITASGRIGRWSGIQFRQVLRTGKNPSGYQMKSENMPWTMTAKYTDGEIQSLYLYLKSLKNK